MKPRFSIAIPVYNRAQYLTEALISCLGQTVHDYEIIVSDDCSSDDLQSVVSAFGDHRIRYSRSEQRLGAVRNHQRAARLAQGDYVVNLNSDDLLLPAYLESNGRLLDQHSGAAAVYSSMARFTGDLVRPPNRMPVLALADGDVLKRNRWLSDNHDVAPTSCLFRRAAFERIGGYRESLRFIYDWELYMRFMMSGGGVCFNPNWLSLFRHHGDQMVTLRVRDALLDVLDLWRRPEYAHWQPSEIADLVLRHVVDGLRRRQGLHDLWKEIRNRGQVVRVMRGMPSAVARRVKQRLRAGAGAPDPNYQTPLNAAAAKSEAESLLATVAAKCADLLARPTSSFGERSVASP